jgi:hypothetical protein
MNPMKEYLKSHKMKDASEACGLSENSIRTIARMSEDEIGGIRLRNYFTIKDKLSVDLLEWK